MTPGRRLSLALWAHWLYDRFGPGSPRQWVSALLLWPSVFLVASVAGWFGAPYLLGQIEKPGATPPGTLHYIGGVGFGNALAPLDICNNSAQLQMTTATTTQLVALVASQKVRVCSFSIQGSTSATGTTL